jgi:hypothetical protein
MFLSQPGTLEKLLQDEKDSVTLKFETHPYDGAVRPCLVNQQSGKPAHAATQYGKSLVACGYPDYL